VRVLQNADSIFSRIQPQRHAGPARGPIDVVSRDHAHDDPARSCFRTFRRTQQVLTFSVSKDKWDWGLRIADSQRTSRGLVRGSGLPGPIRNPKSASTSHNPSPIQEPQDPASRAARTKRGGRRLPARTRRTGAFSPGSRLVKNWGLPKGTSSPASRRPEAARREVTEETGLRSCSCTTDQGDDWYFRFRGKTIHKYCHFFLFESRRGELVLRKARASPPASGIRSMRRADVSYDNRP